MLRQLLAGPPPLRLAVAESMTGGRVQALLTAEAGASEFFLGGITAYALAQKVRHLGVERRAAEAVDGVSAEVARQMARGACALFEADIAVATTGYAEPAPARGFGEPGVYWALHHRRPDGGEGRREGFLSLAGCDRAAAQERAAREVVAALAAYVRQWRAPGA